MTETMLISFPAERNTEPDKNMACTMCGMRPTDEDPGWDIHVKGLGRRTWCLIHDKCLKIHLERMNDKEGPLEISYDLVERKAMQRVLSALSNDERIWLSKAQRCYPETFPAHINHVLETLELRMLLERLPSTDSRSVMRMWKLTDFGNKALQISYPEDA